MHFTAWRFEFISELTKNALTAANENDQIQVELKWRLVNLYWKSQLKVLKNRWKIPINEECHANIHLILLEACKKEMWTFLNFDLFEIQKLMYVFVDFNLYDFCLLFVLPMVTSSLWTDLNRRLPNKLAN